MGRGPEETFSPRRCAGGPQGHGKALSISDEQESGMHTETTASRSLAHAERLSSKRLEITSGEEDVEKTGNWCEV